MENSAFEAIYTGVYIVVFIAAFTVTLYLFMSINQVAEEAYNYGNVVTTQAVVQVPTEQKDLYMSASEVVSFVFNYKIRDLYNDSDSEQSKCIIKLKNSSGNEIVLDVSEYKELIQKLNSNSKYIFKYESIDDKGIPTIILQEVTE